LAFRVIIKAAAGGGRGCASPPTRKISRDRFSWHAPKRSPHLATAKVYVEKYLARPRHVEFRSWVTATATSSTWAKRDCSVQRRHQKLIEEAPSPR
jgi:acetyl-CoA carboxylase biotin carboxylase subunit